MTSYGIAASLGPDLDAWSVWWDYNREQYLAPGATPAKPITPSGELVLHGSGLRPQVVYERILPSLRSVHGSDAQASLRAAALLAEARIGGELTHDELSRSRTEATLIEHLSDDSLTVAESACIALGILARPTSLQPLTSLLNDTDEGRELYGRSEVSRRMQAFAAYGIGLVGQNTENADVRRFATHTLVETVGARPGPMPDDRVAAVIALGLIPPAGRGNDAQACSCASNDALAGVLLDTLGDKREDDLVRAQIPPTLARLVPHVSAEIREEIVDELIDALGKRRDKDEVQQGCALALGLIGDADEDELDREIRRALKKATTERDRLTESFALLALAQIGARPGSGEGDASAATPEVKKFLFKRLRRAKSSERNWTVLALGVMGRGLLDQGDPVDREQLSVLRGELEDSRSPDDSAACSIAVGLCRDQESVAALFEKVDDLHQNELGLAALGLGMTGDASAIDPLRGVLVEARHEPAVLEQASISLALLNAPERVPSLLGLLDECDCLLSKRAVAIALGRSRDEAAVEPLIEMLDDEDAPNTQRTWAAFGLALLAERDGQPWSARVSTNLHYRANPATLTGPTRGGILDLP